MGSRLELQTIFENLLGSRNVYFDPPESVKMNYPAIRYSVKRFDTEFANNVPYKLDICYEVIVIDGNPDSDLPMKVAALPKCRSDRHYVANNLHHNSFTIYY